MDKKFTLTALMKLVLFFVVVLLYIFGVFFWRTYIGEAPLPAVGGPTKPPAEAPPGTARVVLRSSLAGTWYPTDAKTLVGQIEGFFQMADVNSKDNVIALILPHAGYQYSGLTAVYGLKTAGSNYKRIVVIGPSHYADMPGLLSVPDATHYETPLGQVPVDVEFIDKLRKSRLFQSIPQVHQQEHSVQIEVPLLQHNRKDFALVPIVAGSCSFEQVGKAAAILKGLVDDQTLVIASSDFVHYGPNYGYVPFDRDIAEQIKKLDMGAYEYIAGLDSRGFLEYRQKTGATICGYVPIAILLSMLDKSAKAELIKYTTSGEITGDFTNSVSYLAVAFCGSWRNKEKSEVKVPAAQLDEADKKQLLRLARSALIYFLENRKVPTADELDVEPTSAMARSGAAFVTLEEESQLRGCIGDILPRGPLYESVIRNAINAGVNDWRFPPVTRPECDKLTFEISALTVPQPVLSSAEIRIGTDGVILSKDGKSAVFLPQVAPEQGWDINQMLTHLSVKAGLPPDAWMQGASFMVFQAVVFSESEK